MISTRLRSSEIMHLPASPKGMPKPTPVRCEFVSCCAHVCSTPTHECPVSESKEPRLCVERQVGSRTFRVMERTGELRSRGVEAAAGKLLGGHSGADCCLGVHLRS